MALRTTFVALIIVSFASTASAQLLAAKDGPIVYGHHHVNATSVDEHMKFWVDALGGVKTTYPEFRATLNGSIPESQLTVPASKSALDLEERIAAQAPRDGDVHVLPVQGNVYMLVVDGHNVTAQIGRDGVLMVNTGAAHMTEKLQAAVNQLATSVQAASFCR